MITSWKFISAIKNGISWTQIFHSFNSLSNWKLGFQNIFQERSSWVWLGPVLSSYRSLVQVPCLLVRSFFRLFVCSFVPSSILRSFALLLVHWFVRYHTRPFILSFVRTFARSFVYSFVCSLVRSLTLFFSPFVCSFVRSFICLFYWLIRESSLVWFFLCILANCKRQKYCFFTTLLLLFYKIRR